MPYGALITIRNTGKEDLASRYDSVDYLFPAGQDVELPVLAALFFLSHHRDVLKEVSRRVDEVGPAEDFAWVANTSAVELISSYGGAVYTFRPGVPTRVPKFLTAWLSDRFPGQLKLTDQPEEAATSTPTASKEAPKTTATENQPSEPQPEPDPLPKAKKPAKPKAKKEAAN
jgi:hypothetical protein